MWTILLTTILINIKDNGISTTTVGNYRTVEQCEQIRSQLLESIEIPERAGGYSYVQRYARCVYIGVQTKK